MARPALGRHRVFLTEKKPLSCVNYSVSPNCDVPWLVDGFQPAGETPIQADGREVPCAGKGGGVG